jgi:hypothetical protein
MPGPVSRFSGCTITLANVREPRAREREVIAIHDHERPLAPDERSDSREGALEHRAVAGDPAILLGDRGASDPFREGSQPPAVPAGQHQGPRPIVILRHLRFALFVDLAR